VQYHHNQNITYTDCSICHQTPATVAADGTHRNGTVELFVNGNACSSCHSYPPASSAHATATTNPMNCANCHNYTAYTAATHNNGTLDLRGDIACDTCHGDPPMPADKLGARANGEYVNAKVEDYPGGGGFHASHLLPTVTAAEGFTPCLPCHPSAYHNQGNGSVSRANVQVNDPADLSFRLDPAQPKVYDSVAMTCSNISCHYQTTPPWNQ
jgi:hypothetical protein